MVAKIQTLTAIIGLDGTGKSAVSNAYMEVLNGLGIETAYTYVPIEPLASIMKRVRKCGKLVSFFGYGLAVAISAKAIAAEQPTGKSLMIVGDRWIGDTIASHICQGVNRRIVCDFAGRLNVPMPGCYVLLECELEERKRRMLKGRGLLNESDQVHASLDRELTREYRNHIKTHDGITVDTTSIPVAEVVAQIVKLLGLVS